MAAPLISRFTQNLSREMDATSASYESSDMMSGAAWPKCRVCSTLDPSRHSRGDQRCNLFAF